VRGLGLFMARRTLVEYAGAINHVMVRGDRQEPVFRADEDRVLFLRAMGEACERTGWRAHAHVSMGNHDPLLRETPDANRRTESYRVQAGGSGRVPACNLNGHLLGNGVDQNVPVRATPPDGFTFVKWFQTNGDGKFTDPSATGTDFTMGTKDATVVATFVKLETWFPPGPEGTTKGLLLPSSRQASRLEQRIRVTVNRGSSSSTPQFSEIWKALSVRIKWQAATHVRFFTSQRGGKEVKSNTIVPSTSFQPKREGIYEASLWYEGNLTHEQIAQMNPEGEAIGVSHGLLTFFE
jgi:hypothetical protein